MKDNYYVVLSWLIPPTSLADYVVCVSWHPVYAGSAADPRTEHAIDWEGEVADLRDDMMIT